MKPTLNQLSPLFVSRIVFISTLLLAGQTSAFGLVNLGENGIISLSVTTSLSYDSNIRGRESSSSDVIANERISLNYSRPSRRVDISASLGIQATQYFDSSELNNENIVFDLSISPGLETRNSRFVISADTTFDTTTATDFEVGEVVTTRTYGANASLQYTPTRRYGASMNASYQRTEPDSGFSDRDSFSVGARLFRVQSEMLQFSLGGTYTKNHVLADRLLDSETVTGYVGASGQLLPKVSGSVNAGATQSRSELNDPNTTPYLSASIDWRIDDVTNLGVNARNSFITGLSGAQNSQLSISASLSRKLSPRMGANIGVSYNRSDFESGLLTSRSDTVWNYNAGLSYQIARWGSLSLSTSYSERDSDSSEFVFNRFRTTLSLNAKW